MDSHASLHPSQSRLTYLLPWLALIVFLAITYLPWKNEQQIVVKELQTGFDFRVRNAEYLVGQRIKIYEQVLNGVEGLFSHARVVKRNEFRNYVAKLNLMNDYPGIQGLGFALIVPKADKDRHIASIRKQGFPEYTIKPDGERDIYTPIVYIEPYSERNQRTFGYDMYSDLEHPRTGDFAPGMRHTAMEQARDSGNAIISGMVRLIQETDKNIQADFLMYLPVYKYGMPHGTITERRANIMGWVYAPFRMGDLMTDILGEHATEVDIEIYNGSEASSESLMYDSDNIPRPLLSALDARFQATRHLKFYGQDWTMVIHSLPTFDALQDSEKPKLVAIGGIGISILLALLTWLYLYDREHTHNLLRQNRYLSRRMFAILEEERRNLSLELHDEIGQWLTAIQFQAKTISKIAESASPVHTSVRIINESASEMHDALHKIVHNLRPSRLDALGLVDSLNKLVSECCQCHRNMQCEFVSEGELDNLGDNLNITLYRLVQESLSNITRHAHASHVSVKLRRVPGVRHDLDTVLLNVKDDGVGFDPNQPSEGVGLLGMRERIIAVEGKFDLHSEPGQGVQISCELPIQEDGRSYG